MAHLPYGDCEAGTRRMLMSSFFLWPMIIPLIIPIFYCLLRNRRELSSLWPIALSMILIIVLYQPLVWDIEIPVIGYTFWKFVLFVFLPLGIFCAYSRRMKTKSLLEGFGLRIDGMGKSVKLFLVFIPMMLATDIAISIMLDRTYATSSSGYAALMFVESFTEEFFFRGILFLFLWEHTDVRVAYATSIACFVLVHPQYFWGLGMVPVLVQGVLTAVIVHKSKNLTGAWFLHGTSRVFSILALPWLL